MAVSKMVVMAVVCMMVMSVVEVGEAALTCGQVTGAVSPCLGYLRGGALAPGCCPGVKNLNGLAKTTPDRKQACACLKTLASSVKGINFPLAAGLPSKCGVNVPYKISPATDCSKVN